MDIVTEKAYKDRLSDGISTILNLDENDFNRFIEMLTIAPNEKIEEFIRFFYSTDPCKNPDNEIKIGLDEENTRGYLIRKDGLYSLMHFFYQLESYIQNLEKDSDEYLRCNRIIATRNIDGLKNFFSGMNGEDFELIDKLFETLINPDICQKFINFDENRDYFKIESKSYQIEDYLKKFGEIFQFRYEVEGETFFNGPSFKRHFYLPESVKSIMYQNATRIYQAYQERYTRYVDQRYEFRALDNENDMRTFRDGDEPDWNINEELRAAVFNNMPQNLSLEEQALFIYIRLCQALEYNEEYLYRDKDISSQFDWNFSQEHLESIKPGSKITCFDFSRIFSKLVNELDGDIEAVIIVQGGGRGRGHFLTGFYTDKVSVRLESININLNGQGDPTNDLTKAKNGIKLAGVQPIFDREGIINDSLEKVYSLTYDTIFTKGLLQKLKSLPETDVTDDFKLKLESFIEVMRDRGSSGNEFVQTLSLMCKLNFFGKDVEKAYLGKRIEQDGEKHIRRQVLFRQKGAEEQKEPHFYLIDTSTLEMIEPTSQQLIEKFNLGILIYENEKHKITGIDKEAHDDTA